MPSLKFLQRLLYMGIGKPAFDYHTAQVFAMKSGAKLPFCNRVCGMSDTSLTEIENTKTFFGSVPFRWFVDAADTSLIQKLEEANFKYSAAYPAMSLELNSLVSSDYSDDICVQEIDQELLKTWLSIVTKSYSIVLEDEFAKFAYYLIDRAGPEAIHFYVGYYRGIAAAASMVINSAGIAGLHWVATLPEFRGKGLGYAISHKPLVDAQKRELATAILLASDMGKPIYKKIEFEQYALYKVYGL